MPQINTMPFNHDRWMSYTYLLSPEHRLYCFELMAVMARNQIKSLTIEPDKLQFILHAKTDEILAALVAAENAELVKIERGERWTIRFVNSPFVYEYGRHRPIRISKSVREKIIGTGKCVACGTSKDLSVDHIIPVALGGSDHIRNLQCLCRRCNSSKGATLKEHHARLH